jgi:signal transduction histidine kinase/CheY-like chemotaxis protein
MPFPKVFVGLSLKFILLATLLVVLTSLTLGIFLIRSKQEDYLNFLKLRGISLSRTLAFNSEYGILTKNTEVLTKLAQGIIKESDVSYCIIHDADGKILVDLHHPNTDKLVIPSELIDQALQLKATEEETLVQPFAFKKRLPQGFDIATSVKTRRLAELKEKVGFLRGYLGILEQIKRRLKIEGQIIQEKIGTVRVGLSLINFHRTMVTIKRTIGMITLLVAFLGVLITTLLVQLIIRPIRRLVYGTRQVARGDLSFEVKVNSRDEIGELAASFNQMTHFLNRSHDQVEEYRKNLEQMVEERTRKLQETEAELIRSEKFAAIGELITGITHELNNKLTPILGYAQIFKTMDLDETVMKYMDIIEESAVNAKKIVESLLKFSRTAPPQKTYTQLNETMKETLALIEPHVRKNNIQLELKLDPQLPKTMADPALISQAFLNILNNAWQSMEEKGGFLSIHSFQKEGKVFFSIRDSGPGISKENLTRIFDPFFTTKEVGKGTGLGLSISYGIVQNHEGNIHVESKINQGSTFTIALPIKTPEPSTKEISPNFKEPSLKKGGKILVIEDEPPIQAFITDALGKEHHVQTATNGKEAQKMVEKDRFDVYMIDLRMPLMDGKELYQWMQSVYPSETKKVIFITGDTYDKKTQLFLSQMDRPQLTKPFKIENLQSTIFQVLEKTSSKK